MLQCDRAVDASRGERAVQPLRQRMRELVHTADRRNNEDMVANPDCAVFAPEALERFRAGLRTKSDFDGRIGVFKNAVKIRFHIVRMHVLPLADGTCRAADGHAVLDDVLPRGDIPERELVPARDLGGGVVQHDRHIVQRIDSDALHGGASSENGFDGFADADPVDRLKLVRHKCGQSGNGVEIHLPERGVRKSLADIVRRGVARNSGKEINDVRRIGNRPGDPVVSSGRLAFGILAETVEAEQRRERKREHFRQFAFELRVIQQTRHDAHFPLGYGVQGNRKQTVLGERIQEPFHNRISKELFFVFGQIDRVENFAVNRLADHFAEDWIVHHLVDEGKTAYDGSENVRCMRAVEKTHFAGAVRRLVVGHDHIQSALLEGEFLENGFGTFHHEEMEDFTAVQKVVLISEFRADFFRFRARIPGDNAVDERVDEQTAFFEPFGESLRKIPFGSILQHILLKSDAIFVDKFAGDEDDTFLRRSVKCLPALEHQTCELCRIRVLAGSRSVGFGLVLDSCLGGVGENEAEIRIASSLHSCIPAFIRIQTSLDGFDDFAFFDDFPIGNSAEDEGIESVLRIDEIRETFRERLHELHESVEFPLFVHFVDHPVDERTEEISFAELENFNGESWSVFSFKQIHDFVLLFFGFRYKIIAIVGKCKPSCREKINFFIISRIFVVFRLFYAVELSAKRQFQKKTKKMRKSICIFFRSAVY